MFLASAFIVSREPPTTCTPLRCRRTPLARECSSPMASPRFEDFPIGSRFVSRRQTISADGNRRVRAPLRSATISSRTRMPAIICSAASPPAAGRPRRSRCASSSRRCRSRGGIIGRAIDELRWPVGGPSGRRTESGDRNSRGAPFEIQTRLRPHPLSQPDEKPGRQGGAKLHRVSPFYRRTRPIRNQESAISN